MHIWAAGGGRSRVRRLPALLDSGAGCTALISAKLANSLGPCRPAGRELLAPAVDDGPPVDLPAVELLVAWPELQQAEPMRVRAAVASNPPVPLILGAPFLRRVGAVLNYSTGTVQLQPHGIARPMTTWGARPPTAATALLARPPRAPPFPTRQRSETLERWLRRAFPRATVPDDGTGFLPAMDAPPVVLRLRDGNPPRNARLSLRPYPLPDALREPALAMVQAKLARGTARLERSPFSAPAFLIAKKPPPLPPGAPQPADSNSAGPRFRMVVNMSAISLRLEVDAFPTPSLAETFRRIQAGGYSVFSTLDVRSGYEQVRVARESQTLLGASIGIAHFVHTRLPLGLSVSPAIFNRLMFETLGPLLARPGVFLHVDDILIAAHSVAEGEYLLGLVLARMEKRGWRLAPEKMLLLLPCVPWCGRLISKRGFSVPTSRADAIQAIPKPTSAIDLRRALGAFSALRPFMPNAARVCKPLEDLLRAAGKRRKRPQWTPAANTAWATLQAEVARLPTLRPLDPELPLLLAADGSQDGVAAVLFQQHPLDETPFPLRFASASLSAAQRLYPPARIELLAACYALTEFWPEVYGRRATLWTDSTTVARGSMDGAYSPVEARLWAKLHESGVTIENLPSTNAAIVITDWLSRVPTHAALDEAPLAEVRPSSRLARAAPPAAVALPLAHPLPQTVTHGPTLGTDCPPLTEAAHVSGIAAATDLPISMAVMLVLPGDQRRALGPTWLPFARAQRRDSTLARIILALLPRPTDAAIQRDLASAFTSVLPLISGTAFSLTDAGILVAADPPGTAPRPALPGALTNRTVLAHHEFGHLGADRVIRGVLSHYWTTVPVAKLRRILAGCETCKRAKAGSEQAQGAVTASARVKPPPSPMSVLHIDVAGPVAREAAPPDGVRFLIAVCAFSSYTWAVPIASREMDHMLQVFEARILLPMGGIGELRADNEFDASLVHELAQKYGFHLSFNPPGHSATNGRAERAIRWVKETARAVILAGTKPSSLLEFDACLQRVVSAFNTASPAAPNLSPFYLCHGFHPRYDGTIRWLADSELELNALDWLSGRERDLVHAFRLRRDAMRAQAQAIERRHGPHHILQFSAGDLVWARAPAHTRDDPLSPLFEGPYVVNRVVSDNSYELKRVRGATYQRAHPPKHRFHVHDLRAYTPLFRLSDPPPPMPTSGSVSPSAGGIP